MEFREENVYAGQIEISEMYVVVWYGAQPGTEVCGLWIAGNEQKTMEAQLGREKGSLSANLSEVFHIFDSHHNDILWNHECLPVRNKQETAFLRIHHPWRSVQPTRNRFIAVYGKSWT